MKQKNDSFSVFVPRFCSEFYEMSRSGSSNSGKVAPGGSGLSNPEH